MLSFFFNNLFAVTASGLNWGVTYDGVVWFFGWVQSWEGLLLVEVLTTWAEVVIRVSDFIVTEEDDFRSGCWNVSHHYRQQSFSRLHSPKQSDYAITIYLPLTILFKFTVPPNYITKSTTHGFVVALTL